MEISFPDFQKIDMRIGLVSEAERIQGARNLIRMVVDFGVEKRQAVAGLLQWYKPEDLVGKNQLKFFQVIFEHCEIALSKKEAAELLEKYRFEKLAKGRKQGNEDPTSHFRKGMAGDWQNHFNNRHKNLFKKHAGQLLIDLGYEKDNNW